MYVSTREQTMNGVSVSLVRALFHRLSLMERMFALGRLLAFALYLVSGARAAPTLLDAGYPLYTQELARLERP